MIATLLSLERFAYGCLVLFPGLYDVVLFGLVAFGLGNEFWGGRKELCRNVCNGE